MRKLIMLFLIVFIYEKSFSQTCRTEDPTATVDYPGQLGDLLERGYKTMIGESIAATYGKKINWGTVNDNHLSVNLQINYNYEVAGLRELAQKYIATIKYALQLISNQGTGLIEKLSGRPLEFYLVDQEYGAGLRAEDYNTNWIRLTHMVDFFKIGVVSFTHLSNWSRVNKIIINVRKCGIDGDGINRILHSLGHILNEDFIDQSQYWSTRSFYNTRYLQPGNSMYVREQEDLSRNISNLATITRKCFVADVFSCMINGMENRMVGKNNNNRDNVLRQIKARYEWLGGPSVKWNIR